MMPEVLGPSELPKVAKILGEAFSWDPLFQKILGEGKDHGLRLEGIYLPVSKYALRYGFVLKDELNQAAALLVPDADIKPKFLRLFSSGMFRSAFHLSPLELLRLEWHENFLGSKLLEAIGERRSLYIWSIGTTREAQGKGLGRKLMESCERLAREQGYRGLALKTENPSNVSFYDKFDYSVRWQGCSSFVKIPSWVMYKEL